MASCLHKVDNYLTDVEENILSVIFIFSCNNLTNMARFFYTVVKAADWQKVENDVENFLENPSDMNIFTKKNVLSLLQ